jgi:hypothetical protein
LTGGGRDRGDKRRTTLTGHSVNGVDVTEHQTKVDDERDQRKPGTMFNVIAKPAHVAAVVLQPRSDFS